MSDLYEAEGALRLKKGREKTLKNRHPWLYSGGIHAVTGSPSPGDLVVVEQANGHVAGVAYYNPRSQIHGRLLCWGSETRLASDFWHSCFDRAYEGRELLDFGSSQTDSYRLIFGESDGVPGLVVDVYGRFLVAQVSTMGIEVRKEALFDLLMERPLPHSGQLPAGLIERSDASVRRKEGLSSVNRLARGEMPPDDFVIRENGRQFLVNLMEGHKTGFYLDQRDNRELLGRKLFVAGKEVLNTFAYTGGFAVYCAGGNAKQIINVDTSVDALTLAERNVLLNHSERTGDEYLAGDVFEVLRHYRDSGRQFDVIILDPPKFAHSQRDIKRASRGYKDINLLALKILRPGGLLATFSCSGLISTDLFQKIVFGAAVDAGRPVQIIHTLTQGADHPIALTFPESAYLKGYVCRVF